MTPGDSVERLQERVRRRLIKVAREGRTTTYFELAHAVDLLLGTEEGRLILASALREVSTTENASGRPLLSALVVLGNGIPGRPFFELARSLGVWDGHNDRSFHTRELERVWAAWLGDQDLPLPQGEAGERSERGEGFEGQS